MKMKKNFLLILHLIAMTFGLFATEQAPDILICKDSTMELSTGWGHPAPLDFYFIQNNMKSPFSSQGTGNYRGYIATWEIKGNKLYLSKVAYKKKDWLKKIFKKKDKVFASWFTGMIEAEENRYQSFMDKDFKNGKILYLQVQKGKIVNSAESTFLDCNINFLKKNFEDDFTDQIKNYTPKAPSKDFERLRNMYHNYVTFFYRINEDERITCNGEEGKFYRKNGVSPLFQKYGDDFLKWPFNWENDTQFGSPNCTWEIDDGKLYITKLDFFYGTRFDNTDKTNIPLDQMFDKKNIEGGKVFADWVNGIFMISYGYDYEMVLFEDYTYPAFNTTKKQILEIKNGIVKESYDLDADFDITKNRDKNNRLLNQW